MSTPIGILRRLPVREVFRHEAHDFTQWLSQHPDALSGALGIEIVNVSPEHNAGSFRVDLFAEDDQGRRIIIENQLEATDHKHLGQVLTYLTMLDADTAVWITADPRPEHVSAVSWLNENAASADFYLVKVEGVSVDESHPAPLFTRIVGPSEETRAVEQQKRELKEQDRLKYAFHTALLKTSNGHTDRFNNVSPKPRNNIVASAGRGFEFRYEAYANVSRATLYIEFRETQAENDAAYNVLLAHRDAIDGNVQGDLTWTRDDDRRRKISFETGVGYQDEDQWKEAHERLARVMTQLEDATKPYFSEAQQAAERAAEQAEPDA
jgi:hypothetical protein